LWRVTSNYSLKAGTYPGVKHAYGATMRRRPSAKAPMTDRELAHFRHTLGENPPAVEIYRNIIEIRAEKSDGKRYVHKFGKGSQILGLPDGTILIRSRKGKRLWKNFKVGG